MKKIMFTILVSVLLSLSFYNANAQRGSMEYEGFKWNVLSMGYAFPPSFDNNKPSLNLIFSTEPQYLFTDNIGIGLKL